VVTSRHLSHRRGKLIVGLNGDNDPARRSDLRRSRRRGRHGNRHGWLVLGFAAGLSGVVFVGLSTVVVQAMSADEVRARALAIWAAAFVGMLPFGALLTAGLAALIGPGGAVFVDGVAVLVGGLVVVSLRPQVAWLGCAALPEACVAGLNPAAVAVELEEERRAA
jgi:hypothetical protein